MQRILVPSIDEIILSYHPSFNSSS